MTLKKSAVLITGASRGLGAGLMRGFAARGARVVGVARGRESLEELVEELRRSGAEAHALCADIGDKQAIHAVAGAAAALVGPIDVLVHNASSLGPTPLRLLLDTDCEDLEQVLAVNLVGPFRLSKIIAGSMALRGTGVIAHISSDAAVQAYARWGAYSVSKAAQDHLARLLAMELGELGVRILSIDPGEMKTEMHAAAMPEADPEQLADPRRIAERIIEIVMASRQLPNGARVLAQSSEFSV